MSTPCGGSCPIGHILMGNECALQESLCPEAQCVQDSDCQDNAGCLLSGTVSGNKSWTQQLNCLQVMACQCYLNFVATQAAVDSCPRTGVCTHALEYAQVSRIKERLITLAWKEKDDTLPQFNLLWKSDYAFFLRQVLYRHVMSRVTQKSARLVSQKLETPSLTMFPPPEEMDLGQTPTTVINCFTISINSQR